MARSRNIKPAFFLNDELAELRPLARLLFIGLWCVADRDGYLEDKPNKIKAEILPYDDCNINELLESLNGNFIKRYSIKGKKYIFIINFKKHQNPHMKEKPSEIPRIDTVLDEHANSTVQEPCKNSSSPADSLKLKTDSPKLITENQELDSCVDEVIDFYNNNIGAITPYGLEVLTDYLKEMPTELIILAMKKAVEANVRTIQYIKGILNNWSKQGIKTVLDAEEEDKKFREKDKKEEIKETQEERIARLKKEWGVEDET